MMRALVLFCTVLFAHGLEAQILNPVKWESSSKQVSADEFDLIFTARLDKGWTLYSQHTSPDGPVPTSFTFEKGDHFALKGEVVEKGEKKEGPDDLFGGAIVIKFTHGPVVFTQRVKVTDFSKPILASVEFMTCDNERCLPPTTEDFEFKLTPGKVETPEPDKKPAESPTKTEPSSGDQGDRAAQTSGAEPAATQDLFGNDRPSAAGGLKDPVKWDLTVSRTPDGAFELLFTANIEKGWVIYSKETSEDLPLATYIEFEPAGNYNLIGDVIEEGKKKKGPEPLFDNAVVVKFLESTVLFRQKLSAADPAVPVKGTVFFIACDDTQCLPTQSVPFTADLANLKAVIGTDNLSTTGIGTEKPSGEPTDPFERLLDLNKLHSPVGQCGEVVTTQGKGYWGIFILGFLGGLIALLTPCVFPMIPLTVSFFTKGAENRRKGLTKAFMYGFFIFLVYILLSLPFHLMDSIDSGILNKISTNVWLNVAFFAVFVFFALSFFGYYEITLPQSWTNKASSAEGLGGMFGTFFMAVTLALVSFSCTGPILGSLLAGALTSDGGAMQLTMGMGGFGLALALPFALFAAFPTWLSSLPKSGGWLNTVKVTLGFVELALAFKFLSNADLTRHWDILRYEVFLGIWIVIAAGLTLYLFGRIKFPHDSPLKKLGIARGLTGLAALALIVYLGFGFTFNDKMGSYQPLKLMSGLLPPSCYSWQHPCNCPQNLDCFKDLEQGLAFAKANNKPVMIDFTGYNCVNCRKMEEHVWPEEEVYSHLKEDFVLISLYVDEDRALPQDQVIEVPRATGKGTKTLRTTGDRWQYLQEKYFIANSQPYYVLISPDSYLLNAPKAFTPDPKEYGDFLRCGLDNFEQLTSGAVNPGKEIGSVDQN